MRMMLKASIPVEKGSQTIADGSLPQRMRDILGELKPEAVYFVAYEGKRTVIAFFDLADSSQIPAAAEPFFMAFNAEVQFYPAMNAEDLEKGLAGTEAAARKYM
ncbi:MAG: hypothetical protein JO023_07640 [Chloroflexi bacterium]|nr:hypothetical protein [Chloroflexota bacterium]